MINVLGECKYVLAGEEQNIYDRSQRKFNNEDQRFKIIDWNFRNVHTEGKDRSRPTDRRTWDIYTLMLTDMTCLLTVTKRYTV